MPFERPKLPDTPPPGGGPLTVVLAVDCSGSMAGDKLGHAKTAMRELANKYLGKGTGCSIAVVSFGGPSAIYPSTILVPPTQALEVLLGAAHQLQADGGTPMHAAFENIRQLLETVPGKRLAILLTDGQPNDAVACRQTAQSLRALKITIGIIPIGNDADQAFLKSIGDLESSIKVDDAGAGLTAAVFDILTKVEGK